MLLLSFHWGQVTRKYVRGPGHHWFRKWLGPVRHQTIIWPNAGVLLVGLWGTYVSEIEIEILPRSQCVNAGQIRRCYRLAFKDTSVIHPLWHIYFMSRDTETQDWRMNDVNTQLILYHAYWLRWFTLLWYRFRHPFVWRLLKGTNTMM